MSDLDSSFCVFFFARLWHKKLTQYEKVHDINSVLATMDYLELAGILQHITDMSGRDGIVDRAPTGWHLDVRDQLSKDSKMVSRHSKCCQLCRHIRAYSRHRGAAVHHHL